MMGPALTNPLGHTHYQDAGPTVSVAFWDVCTHIQKPGRRLRWLPASGRWLQTLLRLVDDLVVGIDDVVVTTGSFV